jgi:hypothetical protein
MSRGCAAKTDKRRATGDADGLGEVRKKELVKSGLQLGIGSRDDIMVIEDKYGLPSRPLHCTSLTLPGTSPTP